MNDFIAELAAYRAPLVCNPWCEADEDPALECAGAAALRRRHLQAYLAARPQSKLLVIAEAAGYQGCRFTGIPITCERMLLNRHREIGSGDVLPGEPIRGGRTSRVTETMPAARRAGGYNEPTDTVVWGAIRESGLAMTDVLLWNIFPFHPYRAGNPLSNRTPTPGELAAGLVFAERLLRRYRPALILAVGRKSAQTLREAGIDAIGLRHPANGGVGEFRRGFAEVLNNLQ